MNQSPHYTSEVKHEAAFDERGPCEQKREIKSQENTDQKKLEKGHREELVSSSGNSISRCSEK